MGRKAGNHVEAFEIWYTNNRVYDETIKHLRASVATLYNWSSKYKWAEQADARDAEAFQAASRATIDSKARVIAQQRAVGNALVYEGAAFIKANQGKAVTSMKEAVLAVNAGIALLRQAEGLPQWYDFVMTSSPEELQRRYLELDRKVATATNVHVIEAIDVESE